MQECKQCSERKAADEFYRNRTNADGLFGKCKKCSDSQAEVNRKPRVRHNIAEPTVEEKVRCPRPALLPAALPCIRPHVQHMTLRSSSIRGSTFPAGFHRCSFAPYIGSSHSQPQSCKQHCWWRSLP